MSAPFAGSANGSPVPGYYPDPSIPGYIRYWNGTSWVPGTSRPAPGPGEPAPAPPSADGGGQIPAARTGEPAPDAQGGETDDSDEIDLGRAGRDALPEVRRRGELAAHDPAAGGAEGEQFADWDDPRRLHGNPPEPATAWQADVGQQSGFGNEEEQRLSWGSPAPDAASAQGEPAPQASPGAHDPRSGWGGEAAPAPGDGSQGTPGAGAGHGGGVPDHTVGIRMPRPQAQEGGPGHGHGQGSAQPDHTVGLRRSDVFEYGGRPPAHGGQHGAPAHGAPAHGAPAGHDADARPAWAQQVQDLAQQGAGQAPGHAPGQVPGQVPGHAPGQAPGYAPGQAPGQAHPGVPGPAGGPGPEGVTPWRPPVADPFANSAQDARPAGLGKRLGARFVDALVVSAVVGATAFPFVGKATEHIQEKIEATKQAGVTRNIWLVDGTTGVYLAVVLGVFLVFGLLYEALPTAKWGCTLGKKLFGIQVLDVERQDTPRTGAALRRWLTYSVLSLVVLGVVNVLWCLFDRPWRQCWHDKVARTFVAGR